ncbi:MAG: hypothetical protein ACI4P9_07215 [Selenomonadaceae bacterium]
MIKSGTTAYSDMYGPFLESVADVTIDAGIRAALARGPIGIMPNAETVLDENVSLFKNYCIKTCSFWILLPTQTISFPILPIRLGRWTWSSWLCPFLHLSPSESASLNLPRL